MEWVPFSHNSFLVVMSAIVALVAGFTGLSMTRDLSAKPFVQKQLSVALGAVALGGGIWSMHFIGMLGLKLPILFYYDAAITLVSALSAILIVGAALILLHFTDRRPLFVTLSGVLLGVGVLVMHYIGMAGLELCRAVYTPLGVVLSSIAAIGLCTLAIWAAYGQRTIRNIAFGTVCFALAIFAVHYLAMAGTRFVAEPGTLEFGPAMSNETLALGVIFFSFVIFGACLWVSVTYLVPPETVGEEQSNSATVSPSEPEMMPARLQVPCEREGSRIFLSPADVSFLRADGHYTQVYTKSERLFCVWSVTEAAKRLVPSGFLQTHRSYLVNPAHVARFERTKDKGRCVFVASDTPPAPVSRSKLKPVQDALATQPGAIRAR